MVVVGVEVGCWRRGFVGGDDEEGENDVGGEGGDGEDEQSVGTDASGFFPLLIDLVRRQIWVSGKVGVAVDLTNVGGLVEEEAEPTQPIEELGFAHFANLRRKTDDGAVCLLEEGDQTGILLRRGPLESRITFLHVDGRDGYGGENGYGSDGAQDLHLGIAKPRDVFGKIGVTGEVA